MIEKKDWLGILAFATSIGLVLFWTAFFAFGLASEHAPPCYLVYEHAFPLPDILLAFVLFYGAILRWQKKPLANKFLVPAGGALIFLGLLDFSFNFQNGIYLLSTADLFLNAFINLWCVVFGWLLIQKSSVQTLP